MIHILGTGPVGLAGALFLARQGVAPAAIALDLTERPLPDALAQRTLALSAGSWQLLARIARLPRSAPIRAIEVSLLGRAGRTYLSAAELGVDALGQVVRYRDLHRCLHDAAALAGFAQTGRTDIGIASRDAGGPGGAQPEAGTLLTIHAEGDAGPDADVRDFGQSAVLADVASGVAGDGTAYERFTDEGPLAMLPVPEPGRYNLVWCASHERTQQRMALDDSTFAAALGERLGPRFAPLSLVGPRVCAPLARRLRTRIVDDRSVWIGNAAQALHPVAGQGLNLGLRDAFELARCVGALAAPDAQGIARALERYRDARRRDRRGLVGVTDTLAHAFTLPALHALESSALALLAHLPPLRRTLARGFMFGLR
jgi:2-octaprenyl-6-methoxyphenol hydroxylase